MSCRPSGSQLTICTCRSQYYCLSETILKVVLCNKCSRPPWKLLCTWLLTAEVILLACTFSKGICALFEARQALLCNLHTGWPMKERNSRKYSRFSGLCSNQQCDFQQFTLLDRASISHLITIKIIKFGWELFILWDISYGLSFSWFAQFPELKARWQIKSKSQIWQW